MYLVTLVENKTGRTLLNYYEKRRIKGKSKAFFVERIGYLDEFEGIYEDPIAHFKEEAKRRTKESKITLELSLNERFSASQLTAGEQINVKSSDLIVNYGMLVLSKLYHELDIDYFVNNRRRYTKASFNHNTVLQMLVYGRILFPESKLGTWRKRNRLIGDMSFSEDDVYRSLPFFSKHKSALMRHLHQRVSEQYNRDTTLMYYDVTNYYWESDVEDALRARGVSKERRKESIVQMGLLLDSDGIPVTYELFRGNTNDCLTLSPIMGEVSENLDGGSVIYVADKAMMSGENRAEIIINRGGYVFSSSIRGSGTTDATRAWILDENDYVVMDDGNYMYKSRLQPVSIWVKEFKTGKRKRVTVNEVQVAFWSRKYQERARHERNKAIESALQYGSPLNTHGANKYFAKEAFDSKSGDVLPDVELSRYLDNDRVDADELLDGYYLLCSNVIGIEEGEPAFTGSARFRADNLLELNRPVTPRDIIDMYRGLWKIEESFKITKSQLRARPAFVRTQESIDAHFLTCFLALLLLRLLEKRLSGEIPVSQIVRSLREANVVEVAPDIFCSAYCDTVIQKMSQEFSLDITRKNYLKTGLRELAAATKK
ncbi:MAG: IS1634 family transposase [Sphaerochaetaceae bacterium]